MAVVANHHQINLNSPNKVPPITNTLLRSTTSCNSTSSSGPSSTLTDLQTPSTSSIQKSIQAFSLSSNHQPTSSKGKLWQQALQNPIKFCKSPLDLLNKSQFPYEPVNKPNQPLNIPETKLKIHRLPSPANTSNSSDSHPNSPSISPHPNLQPIATYWSRPQSIGPGFYNTGNTCFLNATLQALVHTPALVIGLIDRDEHGPHSCRLARNKKFCALCRMHRLVTMCFDQTCQSHAIEPSPINRAISKFAPSMRGSRQEDAHEFLRLLIEAMQNGALEGQADKAQQRQKESTFIHRMFGGKLRSRVVCAHCNTASDTFDNFLDLSLDISQANSVTSALKAYHKFDHLRGANQYKCEKCKCLRDAKKSMSVFTAPPILTLHLKRFNFRGQKITKRVNFEDYLDLRPAMGEESGPVGYKLYAVVCHRGQSNKKGHYYAHIKASNGKWYLADDSSIESVPQSRTIMANEHAYMLFYARDRESLLSSAIAGNRPSTCTSGRRSPECGKFVKRKPSLSNHSRTHEQLSNATDQDAKKNKRARVTVQGEESSEQKSETVIPAHLLSASHDDTNLAGLDKSNYQPSPTTTNDSSQQSNEPSSASLASHDEFQLHSTNNGNVPQPSKTAHQLSKKNKSRRQKLKHRRLVNMSGTQVPIFRHCAV